MPFLSSSHVRTLQGAWNTGANQRTLPQLSSFVDPTDSWGMLLLDICTIHSYSLNLLTLHLCTGSLMPVFFSFIKEVIFAAYEIIVGACIIRYFYYDISCSKQSLISKTGENWKWLRWQFACHWGSRRKMQNRHRCDCLAYRVCINCLNFYEYCCICCYFQFCLKMMILL